MTLRTRLFSLLALGLHLAFASVASATLTLYSDRAEFEAALPEAAFVESFEDEMLNVDAGSRTILVGEVPIEFQGDASATFGVNDDVVGGRAPTEGTKYLQVGFIGNSTVQSEFEVPLLAFGIDVVDKNVNQLDGLVDDQIFSNVISPGAESNIQFWGVIATPDMAFTKVGLTGIGPSVPGDTFALDQAIYLFVPEPCSLALALAAYATFGGTLRRR